MTQPTIEPRACNKIENYFHFEMTIGRINLSSGEQTSIETRVESTKLNLRNDLFINIQIQLKL